MHDQPKYNLWQNSAYMVRLAWLHCKSVLVICLILAMATAGEAVVQLLIAPGILEKLEAGASLSQLLVTIAIYTGVLILFAAAKEYFDLNKLFGRVSVRIRLIEVIAEKMARTSYENLLDTRFLQRISHRLSSCKFCDEIAVFDQGKVVQEGTHASLMAEEKGLYHTLFTAQAQYYVASQKEPK